MAPPWRPRALVRAPPHSHKPAHHSPAKIIVGLRRRLEVQTLPARANLDAAAGTVGENSLAVPDGEVVGDVKARNIQLEPEVAGRILGQAEAQRWGNHVLRPGSCV